MTYCVAMKLDAGLVFMSDTRTNAGIDNISTVSKQTSWSVPGERAIFLLSAGNLATTQAVVSQLDERTKAPGERNQTLLEAPSMFQVAKTVGETLRDTIAEAANGGPDSAFSATLLLGGQIKGSPPRLFTIYPEGNFIEASDDNPFFQSGETKYGRPILLRAYRRAMPFERAVKLLLVSYDSTLRANLSVGMPLDLMTYRTDSFEPGEARRFEEGDPYFSKVSETWGGALGEALDKLPDFAF